MNPNPRIARQEGVVRRLKMFAEESRNIKSDDAYSDLINRLYTFLMSNGYTDRNLLPLKNALHHHNENKNYNFVEDCILSLAKDIECAGLPISANTASESPAITISNTNHQETSISLDLVHDAYTFIDTNATILANSGISIDVDRLKDSVLKRTFTKKDFLSYIEDLISQFIYQWSYSASTQKSFDVKLLIIDVRKSGKDFKYTFLKDIEPFKTHEVKSIEQGLENSLLFSFTDGELYRMTFPLKRDFLSKSNILITRIENLPQEFDAAVLKDTVLQILEPLLEFQHENEETSIFMKNEFLKLIPFENHSWITREDERQVDNWEYCITHGPWTLSRDRVKILVNMFISALYEYADDTSAPKGWCDTVNRAILSLNSILGVATPPPRFRKSSPRS